MNLLRFLSFLAISASAPTPAVAGEEKNPDAEAVVAANTAFACD